MNNKLPITYLILIISPLFFGCGESVTGQNDNNASASSVSRGQKYSMDTKESVLTWGGSSVEGAHTGYVYISKGELMIEKGQLVGGTAVVDMNSIEGTDHRSDNNLIEHLKNPDFFDVKKFPTSTIAITRVELINGENKKVTGSLTIKGITHPVTFPAKIGFKEGIITANAKLVIDRTLWDIRYNSGKFYDNLADKTISDSIEFQIKIVAKN
jgi:polyisoprenoid-binding protein YceI